MSDAELVRDALAGRAAAWEELVRRWSPRVLAVCHARVGRHGAAEDLAQETLLRGIRSIESLEAPDRFGAWLVGIARRTCFDWLKAKERTQVRFSDLGSDCDPTAFAGLTESAGSAAAEQADETRRLLAEVDALPEELREVLMLFYYDELKYRDIAAMLGVSAATVNARLTKARMLLRERLGADTKLE